MRFELPPQKNWPLGVRPPGNSNAIATPTMEKLTAQGNQAVEQKEVGVGMGIQQRADQTQTVLLDRPAFRFGRVLRYQVTVITY